MKDAQEIGGHRFRDAALLAAALTHASFYNEEPGARAPEHPERLEFLGDAVVGLVIGEELYRRLPDAREGDLTERRAALVSRPALAAVGARLGLLDRARLGRSLQGVGDTFGLSGLIYESVVGAVYLDGGLEAARAFVLRTMGDAIDDGVAAPSSAIERRVPQRSPKTTLQELAQTKIGTVPLYRTVEVSGPDHRRQYVVEVELDGRKARGTGMSMREAQEAAASLLLDEIEK